MQQGSAMSSAKRTRLLFAVLIIGVSLFRMWYAGTLPLTGDEAYHWTWSRNLAGGYYDHPPMTAYVIKATTMLLGTSSELGVRFGAVLLLAGASVALYILGRRMSLDTGISADAAEKSGFISGLLMLAVPIFAGLGVYMSTDPPLIFFCTLSILFFYIALTKGGWTSWIGVGLVVGCALLSKFLCLFTFAGLFLFLLVSPRDRKWFVRPQPYVAGLIALLVFAPFLLWNHAHEWATFKFNLVTRQSGNAFAPKHFPEFLLSQMFAVSPVVFAIGLYGVVLSWRELRREKSRPLIYLACAASVPLAYFLYTSFRRRVGLHWPACGWIPVLAVVPLIYVRSRISRVWMHIMLWSCIFLTVLIYSAAHIPADALKKLQAESAEEGETVVFEDERYGWREAGEWVESARQWLTADQGDSDRGVFLMSGQYGVSAALSFYIPGHPHVHLWAPRRTHGENYRFWDDFPSLRKQDAVYFAKTEEKARGAIEVLKRHFTYVHHPEKLPITVDGQEVRSFYLIKCFIYDGVEPDFKR